MQHCNAKIDDFIHGTCIIFNIKHIRKGLKFEDMFVQSFITIRTMRLVALETFKTHTKASKRRK